MMPDIAAEKAIARPIYVPGQQSPQPIVPIVTMVHHKKSAKDMKSGLLSSARLNILERTMTKVAQRMARECRGQVLKKDLAPKGPQFLLLQMRHILLARVERQMEELIMALQSRQILLIIKISSSELRAIGRVSPKTGSVSCRTTSSAVRLGCTSSTKTSIHMLFRHQRKGLDLFRLISCFVFSSAFLKYLTRTKASMSSVRTDCIPRITLMCSLVKESRASNMEMRIEVSPSKVSKKLANSICSCKNLVKCESSNWRSQQTSCLGCSSSSKICSAVIPSSQLVISELAYRCLSLSFSHLEKASFLNLVTGSNSSIQKIGIFINGG